MIVVCCIYNVYRWINNNLIDKLTVLLVGLIIIELVIVIIDRIYGIMVYGGNKMASTKCTVLKILGIAQKL